MGTLSDVEQYGLGLHTGSAVGPQVPGLSAYRLNNPPFLASVSSPEWKSHEDRDLALFTVMSLGSHLAIHICLKKKQQKKH